MASDTGYALVIDQKHANRTFCKTNLEQLGYRACTAERAAVGLQLLETNPPFELLLVNARSIESDDGSLAAIRARCAPAVVELHDAGHAASRALLPNAVLLAIPTPSRDAFSAAVIAAWRVWRANASQQQAYELAQAEKIAGMGRLSASIAHEINNPLQALQSSLKLLVDRPLAEEKREQILFMANEQVSRLTGIVQHMMDLHRPAVRDTLRPVSIHEVLEAALLPLLPQLHERRIAVERDWDGMLSRVHGVSSQLKQVFGSLVLNAIEAMPQGGRLTLQTRQIEREDGPYVQITFADTGRGIAPDDLPHIFEPFYSTRTSHTGLGLAISYSVVEQHRGKIFAESNDEGATLKVILPALL